MSNSKAGINTFHFKIPIYNVNINLLVNFKGNDIQQIELLGVDSDCRHLLSNMINDPNNHLYSMVRHQIYKQYNYELEQRLDHLTTLQNDRIRDESERN